MVNSAQNGTTDFIMCAKPDLTPIGKMGVWQDHEIGFLLEREFWGQGLAFEGLQICVPYLLGDGRMEYLTADTDPRNKASIGLLKKCGFAEDGYKEKTFEIGGEWVDSQYLRLTKERWAEVQNQTGT